MTETQTDALTRKRTVTLSQSQLKVRVKEQGGRDCAILRPRERLKRSARHSSTWMVAGRQAGKET